MCPFLGERITKGPKKRRCFGVLGWIFHGFVEFLSGWWFQIFLQCSPLHGERFPSMTNMFQGGWFNHQPESPPDTTFQDRWSQGVSLQCRVGFGSYQPRPIQNGGFAAPGLVKLLMEDITTGNEKKKPGCLGYIGDYTTQLYEDYNKPI